ncbi:MAG TPA: twin-arginine translocation signal domain-containing protein, partial [Longimicrobiaceae bacterium]
MTEINRRSFLHAAAAAGLAAAADPRPLGASPAAPGAAGYRVADFEMEEATVAQLGEWMRSGRHTSRSLVEAYLGRIEALDREGPALRH